MGYSLVQMLRAVYEPENGLTSHERLVMLCLARHADENGRCYPSIPLIARECGISESTARRAIKGLKAKRWLSVVRKDGEANTYTCTIPTPVTGTPLSERQPYLADTPVTEKGDPYQRDRGPLSERQAPLSDRQGTPVRQTPEDTQEVNKYAAAAVYKEHQQQENIVTAFERCFGRFPSSYQLEVFESYIQDGLDERLVIRAMEKAAMDGKGPRYAQGILQDWLTKGIRTVEQAEREEREWRERQKVVPMRRTSPVQPEKPKTITLTPEEIARIEAEHQRKIDEWLKDADGETFYRQWLKMKQRRAMNQNAGAAAQ